MFKDISAGWRVNESSVSKCEGTSERRGKKGRGGRKGAGIPEAPTELNVALGPGKETLLEQSCPVELAAMMEMFHDLPYRIDISHTSLLDA